ncbi:hypothetical protein [Alkaliphilus sp. B6464]|uniref:hypothetical protein n=1 Tax=Alkaliphilus sp. B6464 TaxID=2731219 RepID=UPI001BA907E6|nr:hypothetical protein [Alkaliphilus sp. B6464]QUH20420.1 hypothetical protein HYG84_11275 [Alkaliphilus sp. B6464]
MDARSRKELLDALAINYLCEKENNTVFERENSQGYSLALGKFQGACMALNLDFEESENGIVIVTQGARKVISAIKK